MNAQGKIDNKAQDLGGKAKEALGGMTGDHDLKAEGKTDQAKAAIKDVGEKIKDFAEDIGHKVKDAAEKAKDAVIDHKDAVDRR